MSPKTTAIFVLCSGGLDSVAALHYAHMTEAEVFPVFIDYGQNNDAKEYKTALEVAKALGLKLIQVDAIEAFSHVNSPLFNFSEEVFNPQDFSDVKKKLKENNLQNRNAVFITIVAAMVSSKTEKRNIFIVTGCTGQSIRYPDTTPEFHLNMEAVFEHTMTQTVLVGSPWNRACKWEIIKWCDDNGIDISKSFSCPYPEHQPDHDFRPKKGSILERRHCGICMDCYDRRQSFMLAGIDDKTEYVRDNPHFAKDVVLKRFYANGTRPVIED